MPQARLSVPPPSKGKPIALILIFLLLAVGAGLLTWALYPDPPAAPVSPPAPANPRPKLVELPVEDLPEPESVEDAGEPTDADPEEEAKVKRPRPPRMPEGKMDKRQLSAFIRAKQGQVKQCYERRLKTNHMLQGVLLTQIRINPSGRVSNVSFTQDTLHDSSVRNCVAGKIRAWRFPAPEGGAVTVSTPFRFSPRLD